MTLTLPVGVEARRLRFLFDTKSGATPSSGVEDYWDGDINWVTPEDLGKLADRYVRETRRRLTEEGYKSCGVGLAPAGSIVLSKRAPIGQTAILAVPSTCNQGCFLLTKLDDVDERFYFYSLMHLRPALEALGRGSTFMELSADELRSVLLPFPNEERQRLIADYLDRETGRIDGLIAEKERMLALLEEKRAALISRVVTRGLDPDAPLKPSGQEWLGEIPAHWRLERLKFHLLGLEQGWSPQCDNYPAEPDDWGVLKVGAVNAWTFNPAENKRLPDEIEPLREYEIKQHDVLMSRANTTQLLGSVVYVQEISSRLLLCDKLYRLNVNDDQLDREFLVAFLRASPGRFQLEREASGTSGSMQNIGQDTVQNAWIAVPPLAEQKTISRYIADSRKEPENMDAALRRTVDLLRERRSALITAAVTGQIPLKEMTG